KRALALLAIVATAFVAIALFGARSTAFGLFLQMDPRQVGVLVTLWVATALLYPSLRRVTAWFVDTIILHRPDYRSLRTTIARRIDAIRITRERYDRALREQEMSTLATEAELRALRAQINPHFLFNALTTIGHLINVAPERALETLMRLTALLRGVLRSDGEF